MVTLQLGRQREHISCLLTSALSGSVTFTRGTCGWDLPGSCEAVQTQPYSLLLVQEGTDKSLCPPLSTAHWTMCWRQREVSLGRALSLPGWLTGQGRGRLTIQGSAVSQEFPFSPHNSTIFAALSFQVTRTFCPGWSCPLFIFLWSFYSSYSGLSRVWLRSCTGRNTYKRVKISFAFEALPSLALGIGNNL